MWAISTLICGMAKASWCVAMAMSMKAIGLRTYHMARAVRNIKLAINMKAALSRASARAKVA